MRAAADRLRAEVPDVVVRTTVVLDRCTDGTAAVVAAFGVDVVEVDAGSVGVARAAGVRRVEELSSGCPPGAVLVVGTDADCVVPESWLVELHQLVVAGFELVVGAVHPDPADLPHSVLAQWRARHRRTRGARPRRQPRLHAGRPRPAGGTQPVRLHEDVLLVEAMRTSGCRWTTGTSVQTSGRTSGRVTGGFATYLAGLVAQAE